ncbi:caspase family protein [Albidovulum sediminicola]|nr:caspase family protein [Defluviimonas sp. WL0075]
MPRKGQLRAISPQTPVDPPRIATPDFHNWYSEDGMRILAVAAFAFTLVLSAGLAQAKQVALVIGNDAYQSVPALEKAGGDARAVSALLGAQGYDVIADFDVTRRNMARDIAEFVGRIEPGDTALIYYSGHGVEIEGENYLLPVDITSPEAGGENFIKLESFALSNLLDTVRSSGARATLVFLDACRNNPFAAGGTKRAIGQARGLGRITAPEGTFVVFSAGAGQTALDALDDQDRDPNSVFTRLLLPKLTRQDMELRAMIAELRVEVRDLAKTRNHAQFPAYYDELLGEFYFAGGSAQPVDTAVPSDTSQIRDDFRLAMELGTRDALEGFLRRHGDSGDFSVDLAERALESLGREESAPSARLASTSQVEEAPPPASAAEAEAEAARALMRDTQAELNRLGCSAGGADGIAGARTRAAWDRYRAASGSALAKTALGSPAALTELKGAKPGTCPAAQVATGRAPETAPGTVVETGTTRAAAQLDVSGTWQWVANCALLVRVSGWTRLSPMADGSWAASAGNSLGAQGSGSGTLSGSTLTLRMRWSNGIKEVATMHFAGNDFTSTSSAGCTGAGHR